MKKILLIAAIAVAAMGCCKKANCQQDKCCDKPVTECCQKAECPKKAECCKKAECPKKAECCKKAEACKTQCPEAPVAEVAE
ncbi:MAG: hypothetical protein IKW35_09735 [Paludibacteraceae bacterium]|nr:hypothetical protein [Paludibacteraceae bacterium]